MAPFWLTYIVRSFLRSGRRALFAIICVLVGTAGVVALQTAGLTVDNALTSNIRASNGGDISVVNDESPLSRADLGIFARLQRQGRISAWTATASVHATAVGTNGRLVPFSADLVSVPPYPLGGQPQMDTPAGASVPSLLRGPGDVLVSTVLAQELGARVGDRLTVNGIGGTGLHATVRGILAGTSFTHSAAMTARLQDRAALTSAPLRYAAVYANVPGSSNAVAAVLRARFPTATVQTVAQALNTARQEVHDFQQFLTLVGLLALLVAGIGILNAMQSILARRRLEIAMLKAMGFREWTLYLLFGGEAALIGAVGGVLGVVLGAAAGEVITNALAQAAAIQVTYALDGPTLAGGVALGVGATLVFAVIPIVRGAALRPLEMLRDGTPAPSGSWLRTGGLTLIVLLLFAVLAGIALHDLWLATQFVAEIAAACTVIAALFALAIRWLGRLGPAGSRTRGGMVMAVLILITIAALIRVPSVGVLLALGTLLYGLTVVLPRSALLPLLVGGRSLSRRTTRTSLLLLAFAAGILAMTVTLTVATGLQSQIQAALAGNNAANLVVVAGGDTGMRVLQAARTLPGIHGHQVLITTQTEPVRINGRPVASVIGPATTTGDTENRRTRELSGLTGYALAQDAGPTRIQASAGRLLAPSDAGTNRVLFNHDLLGPPYNLRPGETVTLRETGSGHVMTVRAVGFYQRARRNRFSSFFTPPVYGDRALALRLGGGDAQTLVTFSVDQGSLSHDATALQQTLPGVLVIDVGDLTAIVDTILNELLHLLVVITALVLGAGVAVVANGVTLAMLERRREIALFKAIGFGPGSVQLFVLVENALVGSLAGAASVLLTAIALGLLSHFALQQAIGFDPVLAVEVLLVATAIAMVTAYLSALTPVRVRPIEALRNE